MPIQGITQPEQIKIDHELRLSAYSGCFDFALPWYQDVCSLELIDGKDKATPYTLERLQRMYEYLDQQGELYFIEKKVCDTYIPIGDVTFWNEDMPIVISEAYRNQGIGRRVIRSLIERAKALHYEQIHVHQIFHYNTGSRKLFQSCGFIEAHGTELGSGYVLKLSY